MTIHETIARAIDSFAFRSEEGVLAWNRAQCDATGTPFRTDDESRRDQQRARENALHKADAVLSALSAAGLAVVPREATETMVARAASFQLRGDKSVAEWCAGAYRAMIETAEEAPTAPCSAPAS